MEVIWTGSAKHKQWEIIRHISEVDPEAAIRLLDLFEAGSRKLERFPALGRKGRLAGTRELQVQKRYFLVYEISGGKIYILTIWHTSQNFPVSL